MEGGTVSVHCNGDTASLNYASPNDGYTTWVDGNGPSQVVVRFTSKQHESRIEVDCHDGQPRPDISEHDR